ncbi:AfsR/SARP family transcriptional regulator [Streptacidiphilus jiangxiensis]|uniref:DNA-binding transcriptional activator of the SARP family n=1 Tax=Streptacidiphilus jiangxiensis TaxID=235985 RepID=A0A1H7JMM1_STRJI|nr:AfsR/SARP family transcriptional regulator [Streptacidiphilus jiangxiensis]SEK75889.1 DNA-binding transcriptional activator of the SARP family [Streptacidiphilus jiangxiensis]
MEIRVLGPFSVLRDGASILPSAGKPRQILALLALRSSRVVPTSLLMEEVWGDEPPRSAATTLQTYVLQLRRKIGAVLPPGQQHRAKEVLATSFSGYRLCVDDAQLDARDFHDLVGRGTAALEDDDPRLASDLLRQALGLWQGDALMDVPLGQVLRLESLGLEEARMRALELRVDADLQLGRHADLVAELCTLSARHPLNEKFSAQLMVALYRAGGAGRALDEFRRLRRTLNEELGVEPSPRMQRLHRAVLGGNGAAELLGDGSEFLERLGRAG